MLDWWLRVPLQNLPLEDSITVDGVDLRPRMDADAAEQAIAAAQFTPERFVHTADAVVKGAGADPCGRHQTREFLAARIGRLADALRFLYGRDVVGKRVFLQRSPNPDAISQSDYSLGTAPIVPAGRVIKVEGGRDQLIVRAAACWADDELDDHTALRFASAFQVYSFIPALPIEHAFLHQWVALETVVNRWCATAESPPAVKDVAIAPEMFKEHVAPAIRQALRSLTEQSVLKEPEATAIERNIRHVVRPAANTKLRKFLKVTGVSADLHTWSQRHLNKWIDDTTAIRNALMHGRSLMDAFSERTLKIGDRPDNDLLLRWRQSRMIVDRFVMSLIGYEPRHWQFECPSESGGTYRPKSSPGEGAGATTATADDND